MAMEIRFSLYVLLIQQFKLQAAEICYYLNQSVVTTTNCNNDCCSVMGTSPQTACCSSLSWGTLAIPVFVITGTCFFAVCLIYFRPLLKLCLCGCKCPCGNRFRVSSPAPVPPTDNPIYILNNDDLPNYETIIKDSRMKDITPPTYNFVAAHPGDFGIETCVPSAPPQYRSRCNSAATIRPITAVDS